MSFFQLVSMYISYQLDLQKTLNISNLNENTGTYELAIDGILRTEVASLTSISGGTILAGNNYVICKVEEWTEAGMGETELSGFGLPPKLITCNMMEVHLHLQRRIEELIDQEVQLGDIGLIFSNSFSSNCLEKLSAELRNKCIPLNTTSVRADLGSSLLYGKAYDFKGLEKPVTILIGFEDLSELNSISEFYVASTRANYDMSIICSKETKKFLDSKKKQPIKN